MADATLATAVELIARELGRAEPWMRDALCSEYPDVQFFPERGASSDPAKRVCASCLCRNECLDYALRHGIKEGIWGGLSGRERRRMKRALALERTAA